LVFIKEDSQDQGVSTSLSAAVVSFNNLTLTIEANADVKIETRGEWKGDLQDLYVIIDTAVEQLGWKDNGKDKQ
tara:strand:- start:320 stop:541 length:222 start_codon:yes stop_codon:yes gene_type:complete